MARGKASDAALSNAAPCSEACERFFGGADEILALLAFLSAREVAKLRAVSASMRVAVDAFLDELIAERGHRCRLVGHRRLREMARQEKAILFEDFGAGWRTRWMDGPTAQGVHDVRYEHLEVRELRDDAAPEVECPPTHVLSIRGGGSMNFNGLFHSFAAPVKPRRLSFLARVSDRSAHRMFANVFLSARRVPHGALEPVPTFYLTGLGAAEPPDLFTVLVDLSRPSGKRQDARGHFAGAVWLPNGSEFKYEVLDGHRAYHAWRQIELAFDWEANTLHTTVRPLPLDDDDPAQVTSGDMKFLSSEIAGGFTHIYLFSWAAQRAATGAKARCGEIQLTDLWLEP